MARQVQLLIQPKGRQVPLAEYDHVKIYQDLHAQHSFEISVPFDYLENSKASFMQEAHRDLVGKTISFTLKPDPNDTTGKDFAFTGFVTDLIVASSDDYTGSFLIRGHSPDCLMADGVQKRTFNNQTLDSIISQVLQPYSANVLPVAKNLKATKLPYVVQYNESNFAFLNRLLAECREWFFYDGTTLQFGLPKEQHKVRLEMNRSWSSFQVESAIRPVKVALHSYDPTQHQRWEATSPPTPSGINDNPFAAFAVETANSVFTQPSHAYVSQPVEGRGNVEAAATAAGATLAANSLLFKGRSENPDLRLGGLIEAVAEGLGSENQTVNTVGIYRVVSISHDIDRTGVYTNMFTAVLHSLTVPPANPHVQVQPGLPELAEVIDVSDPQHLGRVRVRYAWPVQKPVEAESTWLSVLTPYSGDGKGQLFTPEVGSQVLLNYQQQRAEFPVVLGNLFHVKNKQGAKYTTPNNHLKGIQTAGGNKVVLLDTKGDQKVLLSNSNNKGTAVEVGFKGDGSITIKSNGPVTVLGSTITLEAGDKGEIKLHAKNVSINAEELVRVSSKTKNVEVVAKEVLAYQGREVTGKAMEVMKLDGGTKLTADSADSQYL